MKKLVAFFTLIICFNLNPINAQRYLEEIFDEVEITTDITYGQNITIITAAVPDIMMPTLEDLKMDVYQPRFSDCYLSVCNATAPIIRLVFPAFRILLNNRA